MDTKERLQQCFEKLGYSSGFPKTLHINPSTNFIWQQILNNVKPKQEVEVIRKNIIIDKIEKEVQESSVPEIKVYNRLKAVKDEIASSRSRILEKQNKLNSLRNNRKANYLIMDSMKQRNEEKKMKAHVLKLKAQQQENEIKQIQEMLDKKEISSIPIEQSFSSDAITKMLKRLVEETDKCSKITDSNQMEHSILSSITRSSKACFSTVKKSQTRPNDMHRFISCNNITAARALFTETFKENNKNTKNCNDISALDVSSELLPESCFNFEPDDQFLLSSQPTLRQESFKSNFNIMSRKENKFGSLSNLHGKSISNIGDKKEEKRDYVTRALLNKNLIREIEELYYGGNRDIIWNAICSLLASFKLELEKNLDMVNFRNRDISNDDLVSLNFIYIENNLMRLKNKKEIMKLKNAIREKKLEIKKKLNDHDEGSNQTMELHLENFKLECEINFLHREVYNEKKSDHQTAVKTLKVKMNKSKDELLTKVKEIEEYIGMKEELMEKIKKCQEDTSICIRKLGKYFFNVSWADALKENINSNEMEIFREFPMEYNKQFCFTEKGTFYRDSIENVLLDEFIPNDILYEVTTLLQNPQYTPERIITNILQKKFKRDVLSSLEYPEVTIEDKHYSLRELQEKESYIGTFCESINACIHSSKVHEILKSSSYLRLNMELWLEVPFRRFISKKRIVDGKTYKEYEEEFDYFRNNR